MLKGKYINLRALEPSDIEILYNWENDTDIWKVSETTTPFSKHILSQYLANAHQDIFSSKQLRLIIEKQGAPIGTIELFDYNPLHQRAGVGVWISNIDERKKGYAKDSLQTIINYSFKYLNINQLYCNISSSNRDSIKLFQGLGFKLVGVKKKWNKAEDGWEDEHLFQLLCD